MKKHTSLIVLSMAILCCLTGAASLESLQDKYQRQVDSKIAPLRRAYIKDLEELRSKLAGSGKMAEASQVDREIQYMEQSHRTEPRAIPGMWVNAKDKSKVFELKANGECVAPWKPTNIISWSYLGGDTIYIHTSERKVLSLPYSSKKNAFGWPDDGSVWVRKN